METLKERFPYLGELRTTGDAKLVDFKRDPSNHCGFLARVEWEGEDLIRRFSKEVEAVGFGMKSALAQGGVFGTFEQRGKTRYPKIDISKNKISASLLGSQYSRYPMEIWQGMEFGRFYVEAGAPLNKADLLLLHAEQSILGYPIYSTPTGKFSDYVQEDGSLELTPRNYAYRVRADYDLNDPANRILDPSQQPTEPEPPEVKNRRVVDATGRIRLSSRKQLKYLFEQVELGSNKIIELGEFIVVDTYPLIMPPKVAGLLMVDEHGMRIQPKHLNSPIVDSPFGHDKGDEFNSHLRLELTQSSPHGLALGKVYVRIKFYIENVLSEVAPDPATGQAKMFMG